MKTFLDICRVLGALGQLLIWLGIILLFSLPLLVALFH